MPILVWEISFPRSSSIFSIKNEEGNIKDSGDRVNKQGEERQAHGNWERENNIIREWGGWREAILV